MLARIKDALDKKLWNDFKDKTFFADAYASLDAVKTAWRNPTMHVEKKYTAEESENIYAAVKGFLQNVSARMDEDGLPRV